MTGGFFRVEFFDNLRFKRDMSLFMKDDDWVVKFSGKLCSTLLGEYVD